MKKELLLYVLFMFLSMPFVACVQPAQVVPLTPVVPEIVQNPLPPTAEQYLDNSIVLSDNGQYNEAIDELNKVIELNPNYVEAYYELAKVKAYQQKWDEVHVDCDKTISLNESFEAAYFLKGLAYIAQADYTNAMKNLCLNVESRVSADQLTNIKKITNLVIQPENIFLLGANYSISGGRNCHGDYEPYNNTFKIVMFVNPNEFKIKVNRVRVSLYLEGKNLLSNPKYFNDFGLQILMLTISTAAFPYRNNVINCNVDYEYNESSQTSNEVMISKEIIYVR